MDTRTRIFDAAPACFLEPGYRRSRALRLPARDLEWDSQADAQLGAMNRRLAAAYRDWMEPFVGRGLVRPMSMLLRTAVVMGPTHAIARRWLAGQLPCPLHDYLDELADAASAALSGTPARGRRAPRLVARYGRVRIELVADDGTAIVPGAMDLPWFRKPAPQSRTARRLPARQHAPHQGLSRQAGAGIVEYGADSPAAYPDAHRLPAPIRAAARVAGDPDAINRLGRPRARAGASRVGRGHPAEPGR